MKTPSPPPAPAQAHGLTLIEVLVVVGVLFLLSAMLLPALAKAKAMAQRIKCVNNQKNHGLGLRIFATDNSEHFPWSIAATNGGSREWVMDDSLIWRHWATVSNELSTPTILICPADSDRLPRKPWFSEAPPFTWNRITNTEHISYFLGLLTTNDLSDANLGILGGDRNVTTNGIAARRGGLHLGTNTTLGFTSDLHDSAGNILLGDGSVQQVTSSHLQKTLRDSLSSPHAATTVWLIP